VEHEEYDRHDIKTLFKSIRLEFQLAIWRSFERQA
jgi:hypothetical protein